ncbi:TPA: hypothetical protein N3A49_004533 [Salmonella enterica subsp. salamae serovar 56:l,v:z39]|nr:hypothetical protein [Salmonella enterica subsp. salamae serovar 56:l,v:z39]
MKWRSKQQQRLSSSDRENELAAENARLKRRQAEQGAIYPAKGRDIFRDSPEMKYAFLEKHQAEFSIKIRCSVLATAGMSGIRDE